MQIAYKSFRVFVGLLVAWVASSAQASSDITNRDVQALRGVQAMVMLTPELDAATIAAGFTPDLIQQRAEIYLKITGVKLITNPRPESGDRGDTPSLLIQIAVTKDARGTNTYVTLNLLRERGANSRPQLLYVVQQRGLTRHTVTRNYLMRETDLALNMLREDLRRSRQLR